MTRINSLSLFFLVLSQWGQVLHTCCASGSQPCGWAEMGEGKNYTGSEVGGAEGILTVAISSILRALSMGS